MAKGKANYEHIIENMPVILAASFTLIAGVHGYARSLPDSEVYRNMCAFLVVSYLLGLVVRRSARAFIEEFAPKEEESEPEPAVDDLLYRRDALSDGGADAMGTASEGASGEGAFLDGLENGDPPSGIGDENESGMEPEIGEESEADKADKENEENGENEENRADIE